ncbi:MAG: PDZ domain-containing protein [Phycisphaerales bacterium]|nr:PDZ domain-containing protein [Phycisphaerales bacterium]
MKSVIPAVASLVLANALGAIALGAIAPPPIEVVDIETARALEHSVQKALSQALPASVGISSLGERGSTGSGTIISKDGWILTAGHVTDDAGQPVTIYFHDGSSIEGRTSGLHWNGREDCGLVRFDPSGREFAVAELGDGKSLAVGDWAITLGHTYGIERDPYRPPVLRLGRIRLIDERSIDVDAPLSSGDSGGGLFDLSGRLIGINSTAGPEPDWNTAVNIDFVKGKMSDMQQGAVSGASAEASRKGGREPKPTPVPQHDVSDFEHAKSNPAILMAIAPAVDAAILMTVGVFVEGRQVGLGTVASAEGHVIAKASDVGMVSADLSVALPDGLMVSAKRMAVDSELDLMLLATNEAFDEPLFDSETLVEQGVILMSVGRDARPAAWGVRSLGEYRPGRSDVTAAYLGVRARATTDEERDRADGRAGVILTMVSPASPAARAGLKVGDFVESITEMEVMDQSQVGEAIRKHASGDVIEIVRVTDGAEDRVKARLAPRPRSTGPSPSSPKFPASRRSSGFGPVIQHDTALRADQMGGPVTNLDGKVVGVNIARVDRTKTYALSSKTLKPAIERLLTSARARSEPMPLIDPLATGVITKQEGALVRLDANAAEILGTTLRFVQEEDALGHLERWVDPNDSAQWVVEFTKPGDYAIRVVQACPSAAAGQEFQVIVGGLKFKGVTQATSDWGDYKGVDIGSMHVEEPGRARVEIETGGSLKHPLMNLHAIELKRTS